MNLYPSLLLVATIENLQILLGDLEFLKVSFVSLLMRIVSPRSRLGWVREGGWLLCAVFIQFLSGCTWFTRQRVPFGPYRLSEILSSQI